MVRCNCKFIERISRVWDHVTGRCVLGYKLLVAVYWDGSSCIPVDYSIHREKGKKKDMPFGLKKKVMKNQFRKARNHSSSAYERIKETDVSKIASMVAMLKRALRNKLEVDYVLMDSWFTCWEVVSLIIKRKGLHLIGMYKGAKTKFDYMGKSLTYSQVRNELGNPIRCRRLGIVISKDLTLGELMSTYALIGFFVTPASNLIKVNQSYQNASIAADRLFEIIDIDVKSENTNYNFASEDVGNIVFENVTFGYNNQEYVFDKLSFEVEKGSIATIVGNSGSGKSTIAHILKKMYPIESGKLLIGSTSIEDINSDYLNKIVSIVPQHVQLFTGTILENITFEELNPNMERVANLIDMLGLRRFVDNLPQGLDTYLIENGINLSGGQRQRLAILRALYINPEIIIFDEATSSLDIESESKIVDIMLMLKDLGKTVISISHRIPVLTVSDQILVLDKGRLAGSGKHDSLFENCEVYRRNWEYHMSYVSKS
jgi:ABC-type multidrug transport system fused ATPase/permease subunit